jgi:hypothetical protein
MRVLGWQTRVRNESEGVLRRPEVGRLRACTIDRSRSSGERFECEHACWDPKDGELCLNRVKPGETLVEARSDSDVQIDRQIWV